MVYIKHYGVNCRLCNMILSRDLSLTSCLSAYFFSVCLSFSAPSLCLCLFLNLSFGLSLSHSSLSLFLFPTFPSSLFHSAPKILFNIERNNHSRNFIKVPSLRGSKENGRRHPSTENWKQHRRGRITGKNPNKAVLGN